MDMGVCSNLASSGDPLLQKTTLTTVHHVAIYDAH